MTRPIDPHEFTPGETMPRTCSICGRSRRHCELMYKPRTIQLGEPECLCYGYSHGVYPMCPVHGTPQETQSRRPKGEVCEHFTGKREWGIGPAEPWRICQSCGWPKAQHELPSCPAALTIRGESFVCELTTPHGGWAHSNREAQAIWTENKDHATLGVKGGMNVYTGPGSDPREAYS